MNDQTIEGLKAAIRAAKLALFVIRKQGVMPNSSWESGFEEDLKTAEDALAAASSGVADEIEHLRAALQKIANPIGYFQDYAKQEGRQIDGHMAVQISNDPGWLKSEAAKALAK